MRSGIQYLRRLIPNIILATVGLIIITSISGLPAAAQLGDEIWSEPENLSHSGSATNPVMVVDSNGLIHVFWQDAFEGTRYIKREGDQWDQPVSVNVPFEGFIPVLVPDSSSDIFAFWRDDENSLFYSRTSANQPPYFEWTETLRLSDEVLDFEVQSDRYDHLHVSFVRGGNDSNYPAGVYYRQSNARGDTWSTPVGLYQSPYFRALSPAEARVKLAIGDASEVQRVFVGWDLRSRGKEFLIKSGDGGQTWGSPEEVFKPEEGAGTSDPANITVYTQANEVLLLWQVGTSQSSCVQYYQWSLDGGETWQPRQQLTNTSTICPEKIQILHGNDGPILMLMGFQVALQAWDGNRWSDPQSQAPLSSFIDPETQKTVDFSCLQVIQGEGNELFITGCDAGGGGDIWWMKRQLSDVAEWFPKEALWQPVTSITRSDGKITSLALASDGNGRIHIFWSQATDAVTHESEAAIHYMRWEGERLWSQPVTILNSPGEGVDRPAVALDSDGNLLIAWQAGQPGRIYFSRADANRAVLTSAWSEPVVLPSPQGIGNSPALLVNPGGEIYLAFSIPVNEGRGIYLTISSDGGKSWSDGLCVFDGAATGWEMVDQPSLAQTGNGDLHILWRRYALASDGHVPVALFYARSGDGGSTWSAAQAVAEKAVVWSQIFATGGATIHRFWKEQSADLTTLWHEHSEDNGLTWTRIAPITFLGQTMGEPGLAWDQSGNLHLLQVMRRGEGSYNLGHWQWDGEGWSAQAGFDLAPNEEVDSLAAAVSSQGKLAVVFDSLAAGQENNTGGEDLFFTERSLGLTAIGLFRVATPPPAPTVTQVSTQAPTQPPEVTPTLDLAALNSFNPPGTATGSYTGLLLGGLLAVVVAVAFGFGVRYVRSGRQ